MTITDSRTKPTKPAPSTLSDYTGTDEVVDASAIVDGKSLGNALKLIKRAVSTRSTLPVLQNVLVQAMSTDMLRLTATNLEVGIRVRVPALVPSPMAITVPHKLFTSCMPTKGDVMLTTEYKCQTIHIEAGKTRTALKGISALEFPIIPEPNELWESICTLPASFLRRAIDEVAYAASGDDSRPQLAAVCLTIEEDGSLSFAAADGFRLARLTGHVADAGAYGEHQTYKPGMYLIPAKSMLLMDTLDGDLVRIVRPPSGNQLTFIGDFVEVSTRTVEGTYVDVNRVIPTDWNHRYEVECNELLAAVKSVKPFATDSTNIVRMLLNAEKRQIIVSATAAEVGSRAVDVPVSPDDHDYAGDTPQIALNCEFMLDFLSLYKNCVVVVEGKSYQSPAVFRVGDDLLYVVMPMYLPNR